MANSRTGLESIHGAKSGSKQDAARGRAGGKVTKWDKEVHLRGQYQQQGWRQVYNVGPRCPPRRWGWRHVCSVVKKSVQKKQIWRPAHLQCSPCTTEGPRLSWNGVLHHGQVWGEPHARLVRISEAHWCSQGPGTRQGQCDFHFCYWFGGLAVTS